MKSIGYSLIVILLILVVVMPGYAQDSLFGNEATDNTLTVGATDNSGPAMEPAMENEPLATDQPWGSAIPESAPSEETISLNMKAVDITDVLRVMFKSAGYNFTVDPAVKGKITIGLENVPFNAALRAVLEQVGATFVKEEGIYKIIPESVTATGGLSSVGLPQTPKRLRIVEVRFTSAEEMARIFGGRAAGATALFGGFAEGSSGGGGGGGTSRGGSFSSGTSGTSSAKSSDLTTRTITGIGAGK